MFNKTRHHILKSVAVFVVTVQIAGVSYSQQATRIQEVTVTAQKRSQSISEVGLTIEAYSGDELREKGISSIEDLTRITPGLQYSNSTTGTPVYTLRGIGFYETSLAAYPAVSIYVDEIPLPFPAMTKHTGFDLERVEILKGPQGIFFGQNSTGGALNYIAAKPTDYYSAGVNVRYGRFNTVEGEGYLSGPLTESVSARLSLKGANGDEWQKSVSRNDELGKTEFIAGRLLLDWSVSDSLDISVNINGWKDKSDPQAGQYYDLFPQIGEAPQELASIQYTPENPRDADWSSGEGRPEGDSDMLQTSFRADYYTDNELTLTSISSYSRFNRDNILSPDGVPIENYVIGNKGDIKSFVQEFRIANDDPVYRWIIGANYEQSKVYEESQLFYSENTVRYALDFVTNGYFSDQELENYAIFGNIDYSLTDSITAKIGARYTENKREIETCTYDVGDGRAAAFFSLLAAEPIPPGGCIQLDSNFMGDQVYRDNLNEDNLSWRLGIDYSPQDNVLWYFNIAKGYKAGSFPDLTSSTNSQFQAVTQESVLSYEGGVKAGLLDQSLMLTAAAFYYEYDDKQLRSKIIDPVFGILDALVNIPESEVKGAEFSASWIPFPGLTTNISATYVDAEITKFSGVSGSGEIADFSGAPMPFSPEWQYSASVEYKFNLTEKMNAFLGGNLSFSDSTRSVVSRDDIAKIDSYTLLDMRAGIESADEKWQIMLWGKNLTDEHYWSNAISVYDTRVRYTGLPATYGVSFSYRYD